jgi:hypothetical protein
MFLAGHLNDNVLERYAMRGLSEAEAEVVEDHLCLCLQCQDRLDATAAFIDGLRAALTKSPARDSGWKRLLTWVQEGWGLPMWAGMGAAAAGLIIMTAVATRPVKLGAPTMVTLEATRGASTAVHGTGPFDFELFMPEPAQSYRVELLDGDGQKRWEGSVPGKDGKLHVIVNRKIAVGQYYLHVTEPKTGLQHDYAVRVER